MNIDTINENVNSTKVISHEKKMKVVEGDLMVPDIKPDILSLVNVDNDVYITKQEIENNKLNIEGTLDVCAIYMAEDENGALKSLNNIYTFYDTVDIDGLTENSIIDLKVYKGPTECKVVNGRRINIKSPITLDIKAINNCEYSIAKDIVDDRNIEVKKDVVDMKCLCECKKQDVEVKENISLNENSEPICEILKACIKLVNEDYKISYNKILAKADAIIKLVYVADNEKQSIETFEGSIPVMGFIDYEGINDDMDIKLKFNTKSFLVRPIYQDLKSLSISVESIFEVVACSYRKKEFEIISDVYNPEKELKCDYENVEVLNNIINHTEEFEMVQGIFITDLDNINILNIDATPNITNKNILDGKVALEGNIDFNILYFNNNKRILETKKMELPFQQVIKVNSLLSNMDPELEIDVKKIDYKKVDNNQMQIKINILAIVSVEKVENIVGINKIEELDTELPKMPSIVIYYVRSGDSLWNIAKKYKTTIECIKDYNGLTSDVIYPGQQLIIPRRVKKCEVELL